MGNTTYYIGSRNNVKECKIDWTKGRKEILCKSLFIQLALEANIETVASLPEYMTEMKCLGYLGPDDCEAFAEFSRCIIPNGCFPRLYFRVEGTDECVFFEFIPGTPNVQYGTIHMDTTFTPDDNRRIEDEDEYTHRIQLLEACPNAAGWKSEPFVILPDTRTDAEKHQDMIDWLRGRVQLSYTKL